MIKYVNTRLATDASELINVNGVAIAPTTEKAVKIALTIKQKLIYPDEYVSI